MFINAVSLHMRAATTSTSGTFNDLTTDLIMANYNNKIHKSIVQLLLLCLVFLLYLSHDENGISGSISRHEAKLHVIN